MTLASELSTLADTVRKLTGTAEKLSLSDMTANLQKLIPPKKIVIMDDMAGKFNPEPRMMFLWHLVPSIQRFLAHPLQYRTRYTTAHTLRLVHRYI